MLSRQRAVRPRVVGLSLAVLSPVFLAIPSQAQTPSYPSVPAPQHVDPNTLPSLPAATRQAPAQTVPTPAQAPQPGTGTPATTQQVPQQPAYTNPLDVPNPTPQTAPATPQQQPANPLDAPLPAPGASAPPAPVRGNPLEQPITMQPAQPPQASPVDIAAPAPVASLPSMPTDYPILEEQHKDNYGSTYLPDDSWVYPEALRLYSMGFLDSAFISMRPWTRRSLLHMLEKSEPDIRDSSNDQAKEIYAKLTEYLKDEVPGPAGTQTWALSRGGVYGIDTAYTRLMGITGLTLRDSYHIGQTLVNDYGRPYQPGFNNLTGFSTTNEWKRFSFYVRGEYQHAPSAAGYDFALSNYMASLEYLSYDPSVPQPTVPAGPIAAANPFRLQEAYLSFHVIGHEISVGKTDAWLGPAAGGSMAWSNNAENIYSFRINRVEPLHIPYVSKVLGPLRYDFFVGTLKGHTYPNAPWVHAEMFSLRPTNNFEFSFERTVIWGGEGHVPITFGTFFRSFFSLKDTQEDPLSKGSRTDPGARYSDFSFSWRLPFLSHYVTLYTDSIAHDDVTPISAPRRAAYRPGIYLSRFPGLPRLDFRAEASSTDCSTLRCLGGVFNYFEAVQRQGYTNKGFIMGDWVGREAKAGQAWLTYHLSGNEWAQVEYLYKKTPQDFIVRGTTQQQIKFEVVKRLRPDIELDAWYQYEHWAAPVYKANEQSDNVVSFQFTFYPKLHTTSTRLNGK